MPQPRLSDEHGSPAVDSGIPTEAAGLLDGLLGLQAAFQQCNEFAVDPDLSDGERAECAALSTQAFGIARSLVGTSLCLFLRIVYQPQTTKETRVKS